MISSSSAVRTRRGRWSAKAAIRSRGCKANTSSFVNINDGMLRISSDDEAAKIACFDEIFEMLGTREFTVRNGPHGKSGMSYGDNSKPPPKKPSGWDGYVPPGGWRPDWPGKGKNRKGKGGDRDG